MRVEGLDGRTYSWNLAGHVPLGGDSRPRSADHVRARTLLEKLFPSDRRLEEVPLPGMGLFVDFYIPLRGLMVEVNGPQHYEFVRYFHKTWFGFLESLRRDREKREWCELNELVLVELPYTETNDEWTTRIIDATAGRARDG